ncbi:MAG: ATP phosphoribosyltransferase regulatory subunit [Oscillospiraceae bacterium]
MKRYDLITPEGTRDMLFEECLSRRAVEQRYAEIFRRMGYSEVLTPGIEFYDLFSSGTRKFPQESLYKLTDAKGRLLALRPDSTIPIARLVATRLKNAFFPLRLYYSQNVYENNVLLKGRSDETAQAGIELIGIASLRADYEVMCTAVDVLTEFQTGEFRLEIGDIGFFRELAEGLGVDGGAREEIRFLIETKNYPALNDLLDGIGENPYTAALKQLPGLFGGEEVFEKAAALVSGDSMREILDRLHEVYNKLTGLGYGGRITVDLGIVNRTDYYTGIVFQGYLSGIGEAVLKGGRYNRLLGEFGLDVPATGFAVNVDAVASLLRRSGEAPKQAKPDCVVFGNAGYVAEAIAYAQTLVAQGLTVENGMHETLEETVSYARKRGIKKIIIADTAEEIAVE